MISKILFLLKKSISNFLLLLVFYTIINTNVCFAQNDELFSPNIYCSNPSYNFGQAYDYETVNHTFIIQNNGSAPLKISDVIPGCGCTSASIENKTIPPGGKTNLSGTFNLKGRKNAQKMAIIIHSNDSLQPRYSVYFKGIVNSEIDYTPQHINLTFDKSATILAGEISITCNSNKPFQITEIKAPADFIKLTYLTIKEDKAYCIKINVDINKCPKNYEDELRIYTNHPNHKEIIVPLVIRFLQEITFAPSKLSILFDPNSNEKLTKNIMLTSPIQKKFKIINIDLPDKEIQTQIKEYGPYTYSIKLTNITPDDFLNGKYIRITTDLDPGNPIKIPVFIKKYSKSS